MGKQAPVAGRHVLRRTPKSHAGQARHGRRPAELHRCTAWPASVVALFLLASAIATAQAAIARPNTAETEQMEATVNGQPVTVLMDRLVSWLHENGAHFDKVRPTWSRDGGFTLQVIDSVKEGECLIQAPLKVLLGPKAVEASWLRSLLAPLPVPEQVQVLLMWEEANASSFFRPYLDMLPQTFDTPLFWTREQAKELEGTQLLERSITLRHEMPRSYHYLKTTILDKHPGLFPLQDFSYDRYLWSYSVVRSRAFGNFTLMPLIDLMNHDPRSRLAPTLMADGTGKQRARGFAVADSRARPYMQVSLECCFVLRLAL